MEAIGRIKPKRLRPGDTIGVIAPASPGEPELAAAGVSWLEERGYRVQLGVTIDQTLGYLSGPDAARAADINAMFASPDIAGIVCLRGGYGTMRLLELLDYDNIRTHPKVFVGYSDITALHISIGRRTGLITFHGPMAASDMGKGLSDYTWEYFSRAISAPEPLGPVSNPPAAQPPVFIVPGTAQGYLAGGNLSLIAATLGTPYEIDTCGKILCLEEVGEAPYRIDRMLTQLLLAGKLQNAAGIVFDVCVDCDTEAKPPSFTVAEVLGDRLGNLNKPVLYNLYFGHTADKATLPLGVIAVLDTEAGGLVVTETATSD
ncbi:MAG TPA: LD-carboxypeptidase [Methylomusa anaerophila]|uniref:Putative murein peptide carboxypeptidase n=1 Tax=Methylomusa anaerophila TaxID=1930071 RepID=A0A348AGG5_9FIRM|nr:LD-carboxypeptidase [Methylomusa anaerophila]BBB90163.1 putative murein peptide carboxypeptidase [Methylomusa anaerophila]HML88111.1 LD-carboxypeptidase [Methylomusa anaerophila]